MQQDDQCKVAEEQGQEAQAAAEVNTGETVEEPAAAEEKAQLLQAMEEKQRTIEELQSRLQRLQADFDNFRRRTQKEREELGTFVAGDVILRFLPVIDNMARALDVQKTPDADALRQGMDMIYRQLVQNLEQLGVEKVAAEVGEPFDPACHEAVMATENPELADNSIEMLFETGYRLKERVLRPAKVRVNRCNG